MNKTLLITGVNGGIGRAMYSVFANAGYKVIGTDKDESNYEIEHYLSLDLLAFVRDSSVRDLFATNIREILEGKPLHVLVNNAATQILGGTEILGISSFSDALDINVLAPFLLSQTFLPELEQAKGSVVNIGSIHAKLTKPKFVAYATSKAGLVGLTKALAVDLGGRVRVNVIQPAATATEMLKKGFVNNADGYSKLESYHPIGRIAEAYEIAQLALFLASDQSGFITGSVLDIDGGIGARLHDPD